MMAMRGTMRPLYRQAVQSARGLRRTFCDAPKKAPPAAEKAAVQGKYTPQPPPRLHRRDVSERLHVGTEVKAGGFGAWYAAQLEANPIITKSITSGIICAGG